MVRTLYAGIALVDTSAAIALKDPADDFHTEATAFFESTSSLVWTYLNITAHETFTRRRYDQGLAPALESFDHVRESFRVLDFQPEDEDRARSLLSSYSDQVLSFHDALCAAVMLRHGIAKVFTFDSDFWILGFEVVPGMTR